VRNLSNKEILMAAEPLLGAPSTDVVQSGLRALARVLRQGRPLTGDGQETLAALLDELSQALIQPTLSVEEVDRLTACASRFAQAGGGTPVLHAHSAAERVEAEILGAGARASVITGAVRRFLDALAAGGI
jgi:hypothetical protein